jgi:hypothetical protein
MLSMCLKLLKMKRRFIKPTKNLNTYYIMVITQSKDQKKFPNLLENNTLIACLIGKHPCKKKDLKI